MRNNLTKDEFIKRLEKVNPDYKKDYILLDMCLENTDFIYIKNKYGICRVRKQGLLKKQKTSIHSAINKNEYFLNKSTEVHGDKYDYSSSNFKNGEIKIDIICKKHGLFSQTPSDHFSGGGCKQCQIENLTKTNEQFIKESKFVHGDLYDYSLVNYKTNEIKISLICSIHGQFQQKPTKHLKGQGCPKCGKQKAAIVCKNNPPGWSYTNWEKTGNKSKNFDSFKCYIIQCQDSNKELFYKIGKTFLTIQERFRNKFSLPYNYLEIKIIEGDARYISELEKELQSKHKQFKYMPKKKFNGMYECFSEIDLSLI